MHDEACSLPKIREKLSHIFNTDCYAACRWSWPAVGQMEEYGTPTVAPAWPGVMVEHYHHVVKMIITPEFFVALWKGRFHRLVVAGMIRLIAPAHVPAQWLDDQWTFQAPEPGQPVTELPAAARSGAIPLPFQRLDAGLSQRAGKREITGLQPTIDRSRTDRENVKISDDFAHGQVVLNLRSPDVSIHTRSDHSQVSS